MSTLSDAKIVEQCLRGDWQEFAVLVDRYERTLFNAAYRIVGSRDEAADITQQTFVKAYENLRNFNPEFKFFSWIYRIVMNEALTHISRAKRLREVELPDQPEVKNPEELLQESENSAKIHSALQQLPAEQRTAIILRHFHDLSYREMADILRIPEKTVKSRLYSARQQLVPLLKKAGIASVQHE